MWTDHISGFLFFLFFVCLGVFVFVFVVGFCFVLFLETGFNYVPRLTSSPGLTPFASWELKLKVRGTMAWLSSWKSLQRLSF